MPDADRTFSAPPTTIVNSGAREEVSPAEIVFSDDSNALTAPLSMKRMEPADRAQKRFRIEGNAIVTGGAGFLGLEACRALLEHGLSGLCIFDVPGSYKQSFMALRALEEDFPNAKIVPRTVDVTDENAVQRAVRGTADEFGSVDMLLCFAGIVRRENASDIEIDSWRRIVDINMTGTWLCAQAAGKQMIAQGSGGSILFVSSISGHITNFPQPQAPYNASKAAVIHLARSLAAEWARHGIRVNSVSPGYMETLMTEGAEVEASRKVWKERNPMGRIGDPEELMGAVVLLCSKIGGRYMTGTDIVVDGGQTVL